MAKRRALRPLPGETSIRREEREPDVPEFAEIFVSGDLNDSSEGLGEKLLEVEPGGKVVLYFDSPGGNPYSAMSLASLLRMRSLNSIGVVSGECSSAAVWIFAACQRRLVTPLSVLLFHPMRWQSEENTSVTEAREWSRHFAHLEAEMDRWLVDLFGGKGELIHRWMRPGRYVLGPELADAGLAELVPVGPLPFLRSDA